MIKYQTLFSELFLDFFKFKRYSYFPVIIRSIVYVFMFPTYVIFAFFSIVYQVVYFFIVMFRVPADFIKQTIEENDKYHPAVLVVVFLISYPLKFVYDISSSTLLLFLAWIFFFLQIIGFIGSLGNTNFQPYLMRFNNPVSKPKTNKKMSKKIEYAIYIIVSSLLLIDFIIIVVQNVIKENRLYDDVAYVATNIIIEEDMTNGYIINSVVSGENDTFVFKITYAGEINYYVYMLGEYYESDPSGYFSAIRENRNALDVRRLTRLVDERLSN